MSFNVDKNKRKERKMQIRSELFKLYSNLVLNRSKMVQF